MACTLSITHAIDTRQYFSRKIGLGMRLYIEYYHYSGSLKYDHLDISVIWFGMDY